jgi:hypothetical protein
MLVAMRKCAMRHQALARIDPYRFRTSALATPSHAMFIMRPCFAFGVERNFRHRKWKLKQDTDSSKLTNEVSKIECFIGTSLLDAGY